MTQITLERFDANIQPTIEVGLYNKPKYLVGFKKDNGLFSGETRQVCIAKDDDGLWVYFDTNELMSFDWNRIAWWCEIPQNI